MLQLLLSPVYGMHEFKWQKLYGPTYRLKGCFSQDRLMVSDPISLQYIVNSPYFELAPLLENMMNLVYGRKCVLGLKGEPHRRLRAALNVGFTASAVRTYQPILEKVAQTLTEQLETASGTSTNICPLLSTATLSAVGEAVFGYSLQDLGEEFKANNT
ncbi:cytochrome P450 [Mycena epipterygia]|nr:cytochrome P450 [Mycena epipterygia]